MTFTSEQRLALSWAYSTATTEERELRDIQCDAFVRGSDDIAGRFDIHVATAVAHRRSLDEVCDLAYGITS